MAAGRVTAPEPVKDTVHSLTLNPQTHAAATRRIVAESGTATAAAWPGSPTSSRGAAWYDERGASAVSPAGIAKSGRFSAVRVQLGTLAARRSVAVVLAIHRRNRP